MTKYMEPLIKVIILLMIGMLIMRIRYLWSIFKQKSQYVFRNKEGDLSIVIFFLLVMNRARFQKYELSYQPLLRYLYPIIVGLFIAYCFLQFTQIVILTKNELISSQGIIENQSIVKYNIQKYMYGYKITIFYMKNNKEMHINFMVNKKNKEILDTILAKRNVNIM